MKAAPSSTTGLQALRLLLCGGALLLAACRTTPPDNQAPVVNLSLSSTNLEMNVDIGSSANGYDYFTHATSESIATNPDNLQTVTIDSSGVSGLITVTPITAQNPGIYELGIDAVSDAIDANPAVTASNLFIVNVLPAGQPDNPTIVGFPMQGNTTETASITLLANRNGITNGSTQNLQLLLPDGSDPASSGVTVTSITPVASGTDVANIVVNLTVNTSQLVTSTVTDNLGNTYSNGILLEFTAATPSNGYNCTPYTEMVYLRPE